MATNCIGLCLRAIFHAVCFNGPLAFCGCYLVVYDIIQIEFRIATIAMFTSDLNAGVVPHMSPPLHDLEGVRTTMVDFIVIFNRGCSVVSWILYG